MVVRHRNRMRHGAATCEGREGGGGAAAAVCMRSRVTERGDVASRRVVAGRRRGPAPRVAATRMVEQRGRVWYTAGGMQCDCEL
jgi:hypothetical protein